MSFRDTLKTVVNYEDIDGIEGGVEFDSQDPAVMDQIEAMEAEVELVEATNELDNDVKGMDEGDAMAETADAEVAAAEEVVAEADAKAAETGEAPAVPVEDVVASQEALKTLIRQSGIEYDGIFASREDLYTNSYAAYTSNLEDLRSIGKKIKEGLKKIWEKIKQGFKWIIKQIKKVLPTKLNRIKWLADKIREYSVGTIDKAKLNKYATEFRKDNKDRFAAVAGIVGPNLEHAADYGQMILINMKAIETIAATLKVTDKDDEYKVTLRKVKETPELLISKLIIASEVISATAELKKSGDLAGMKNPLARITGITGRGTTLKITYTIVSEGEDKDTEDDVTVISRVVTVPIDKAFSKIVFSKENALNGLTTITNYARSIANAGEKLDNTVDKIADKFGEAEGKWAISKMYYAKRAERALRKAITDNMTMLTGYDSAVLGYALTYGKATLNALKDAKKN